MTKIGRYKGLIAVLWVRFVVTTLHCSQSLGLEAVFSKYTRPPLITRTGARNSTATAPSGGKKLVAISECSTLPFIASLIAIGLM